jgi:glycogen phosphorylase
MESSPGMEVPGGLPPACLTPAEFVSSLRLIAPGLAAGLGKDHPLQTRVFRVMPRIPERLSALREVAYNLWWTWNPSATDLFRWIDPDLWEKTLHNPVLLLGMADQKRLEELAEDGVYLSRLKDVARELEDYLGRPTWFDRTFEKRISLINDFHVGYFSTEFGLHESLPIYSGGLGVLSGDTLKSASDLGLPMVGMSLLYRKGYFSQYLNSDGWQQERYFVNDYSNTPVIQVFDESGVPVTVSVPMAGRSVVAALWMVRVGRTCLYLLDSNLEANTQEDREITGQLYGGDKNMRIRQEILLGIGGLRALDAIGRTPAVCHVNEGHSAFLILERIRQLMSSGLSFAEAREVAAAGTVFTTHTPVPAGNEEFSPELVSLYLGPFVKELGISIEDLLALGRNGGSGDFSMTVFALRLARFRNGVSKLHGKVSRSIWKDVWPGLPEDDVPIGSVTNGVHLESWISDEMGRVLDRYTGPRWPSNPWDEACWTKVDLIPDSEIWRSHVRLRERLVSYSRERWREQLSSMGMDLHRLSDQPVLNPDVMTIGFARRFATYKRATLLLRDPVRLQRLLGNPDRPVQIIFAGKAHPHDEGGKEMIRHIVHASMKEGFYGRFLYLEDYSMDMARHFVQGVDVWLNAPRRPLEASGTSGMKAGINGALNCSVLDGWWDEAYRPGIGWAIGGGETWEDVEDQDAVEAKALFDMLENVIVPLFYERSSDGLPRRWIGIMKESMKAICPVYSTNRMLAEYTERYFIPSFESWETLAANSWAGVKELAAWKQKVRNAWNSVKVVEVDSPPPESVLTVGDAVPVTVRLEADGLDPLDLSVEIHLGRIAPDGRLEDRSSERMTFQRREGSTLVYSGSFICGFSGNEGFTIRVLPSHRRFGTAWEPGLVTWWI